MADMSSTYLSTGSSPVSLMGGPKRKKHHSITYTKCGVKKKPLVNGAGESQYMVDRSKRKRHYSVTDS